MSLHLSLAVAALASSGALLFLAPSRALAAIALVASGLEVALVRGLVHLAVAPRPLGLGLGLALAVPALLLWLRAKTKPAVSAAVVVAFVGIVQVSNALGGGL